jgi:hypothetical protein
MHFGDLLKHSRPGHHQHKIELPALTDDITLCIVYHIYKYLISGTTKQSPEKSGRVRRLNISLYVY